MEAFSDQLLHGNQESSRSGFLRWWYRLTSVPDPPASASFVKREAVRRSHLLSIVVLCMLVVWLIFLPASLMTTHIQYSTFSEMSVLPVCLIAIILNRSQKVFAAGLLIVIVFEITLSLLVITTHPSDELSLGQYTLPVMVELTAVILLPPSSVFFVAAYNIAFTIISLLLLPHAPTLTNAMQEELTTILARPISLQLMVAVAGYVLMRSALGAIARADRAEVIAALEHQIAEEKQQLEAHISQIVQSYIDATNGNTLARIPFAEETKVLWPLINVIDSLQRRLRNAQQTEYELQELKDAISQYTDFLYNNKGQTSRQQWPGTRTDLDQLLSAIKQYDSPPPNTTPED